MKIPIKAGQLDIYTDVLLNMADFSCALSLTENMEVLLQNTKKKVFWRFSRKLTQKEVETMMHENGYFKQIVDGTVEHYKPGVDIINDARTSGEIDLKDLNELDEMVKSHKYNYGNHQRISKSSTGKIN